MSSGGYDPFGLPEAPLAPHPATPQPTAAPTAEAWVGLRAAGWLIDFFGVLAIGFGVGLLSIGAGASEDAGLGWAMLAAFVIWVLDTTVLVALSDGRSVGKLVCGMRLVNDDGSPAGASLGFRRDTLLRLLYLVPVFFIVDSSFAFNQDGKTLRDRMVNSRVLKTSPHPLLGWSAAVAVLAAFSLVASAAPESWSDSSYSEYERADFIEECQEFAGKPSEQECGCYYDYALEHLGRDDFSTYVYGSPFELSDDATPPRVERVLDDALDRCAEGNGPSPFKDDGERRSAQSSGSGRLGRRAASHDPPRISTIPASVHSVNGSLSSTTP